jgi:hypothetical protein
MQSIWRNGGGRTVSPPRRRASSSGRAASGVSSYRHGDGDDVEPVQFRQTVIFEDLGGSRTRITWRGDFPSATERDRVIKEYGADKGLVQTMARLADYVAAQART